MIVKKWLSIVIMLVTWQGVFSQDYTWWNNLVNWDGITHWHNYINIAPAFLGPNALPVPGIKNGLLPKKGNLKIGAAKHFSQGDQTENLRTELYIPLFSDRVGLIMELVPLEHYKMDHFTRDLRKARDFDGKGIAVGDLYFGTFIQLIENKDHFPDILLTINFKTASGTKLSAARYTDTPGYFFDLSFGRNIKTLGHLIQGLRPYALLGFYSWQIYGDNFRQNDSFLYGLGVDLISEKFELKNSLGGYLGYIGNGDRPLVYRLTLHSRFNSMYNYELGFQQGIYDFNYTSVKLPCNITLGRVEKLSTREK